MNYEFSLRPEELRELDRPIEREEIGEHLSFNTWHALAEHRPLGVMNRVRKFIYEEMYEFRHKHNNIEDKEPEAGPDFFNDTK